MFADIAGFTACVADFCRSVRAELPASGGTEVKTIGDAVMLTIPIPPPRSAWACASRTS